MIRNRISLWGKHYFFSPQAKNAPMNIFLAGITFPVKNYNITININKNATGFQHCQFEYVTAGKGYIETNDTVAEISEGDFFLIKKNVPRKISSDKKNPLEKLHISAEGPILDAMLKNYGFDEPICILKVDVESHFKAILNEIESAENQSDELCDFIARELLGIIQKARRQRFPNQNSDTYKIAYNIAEYISANLHRKITLEELCKTFYMGETHLTEIFKARYGTTPIDYVQIQRIGLSVHLLQNTEMRISEIAEAVGFYDSGYFARVFKKHYGTTPLVFRKNPKPFKIAKLQRET